MDVEFLWVARHKLEFYAIDGALRWERKKRNENNAFDLYTCLVNSERSLFWVRDTHTQWLLSIPGEWYITDILIKSMSMQPKNVPNWIADEQIVFRLEPIAVFIAFTANLKNTTATPSKSGWTKKNKYYTIFVDKKNGKRERKKKLALHKMIRYRMSFISQFFFHFSFVSFFIFHFLFISFFFHIILHRAVYAMVTV